MKGGSPDKEEMMLERMRAQVARRIAKVISAQIDAEWKELFGDRYIVDLEKREQTVKIWAELAERVLEKVMPEKEGEIDEAIKLLAASIGRWSELNGHVRRLWFEDLGNPLPAIGPPLDKTIECECAKETGAPWEDCPWCGGCGWMVPQMKQLLDDATHQRVDKKPVPEPEAEPDRGAYTEAYKRLQDLALVTWPMVDHLHGLGATRVDITHRGGLRVNFPPRKDKPVDEKPGKLCSDCLVWMLPSAAQGQLQWTCPECSRIEVG